MFYMTEGYAIVPAHVIDLVAVFCSGAPEPETLFYGPKHVRSYFEQ